mgnify:CR=1 FL=1
MSARKLRFAIFGNTYQAHKSASVPKILFFLYEKGSDIYVDKEFYDFLTVEQHLEVNATQVFEGDDFDADFVVSMGGDGTFLMAAARVAEIVEEMELRPTQMGLVVNRAPEGKLDDGVMEEIEKL